MLAKYEHVAKMEIITKNMHAFREKQIEVLFLHAS